MKQPSWKFAGGMSELYFLRHGKRIDHVAESKGDEALYKDYRSFDPSLAKSAVGQIKEVADDILDSTLAFQDVEGKPLRKSVYIHFSPYLRCCQTADMLLTELRERFSSKYPSFKIKFHLLGDFALSEWIHENMKNKPEFLDSNDAYELYTPNAKLMKNKSACSNFRPMISLGHFNGLGLSYKDYQANCKSYLQKLLATYDKPVYVKNHDIIIVVAHGYAINNFMSYFINHPIFDEIPEAKINFALRKPTDESSEEEENSEDFKLEKYHWVLVKDALGILQREDIDATLNLDTDIVYYKTNFFKKGELNTSTNLGMNAVASEVPRPSFRMESTSKMHSSNPQDHKPFNPICPGARDWNPQRLHQFRINSDFRLKVMNDDSFKKTFDIRNHPSKPISPDVSPNSAPTRNNSVIDLSKLYMSTEINKPMKLKYSSASEIPIQRLNSKVNSQVNLSQLQRERSSNDNSHIDLPKYASLLHSKARERSTSNPLILRHGKDSYFPSSLSKKDSFLLSSGLNSSLASEISIDEDEENDVLMRNNDNSGTAGKYSRYGSPRSLNTKKPDAKIDSSSTNAASNNATKRPTCDRKGSSNSKPMFYNFGNNSSSSSDAESVSSDEELQGTTSANSNDALKTSKLVWFG